MDYLDDHVGHQTPVESDVHVQILATAHHAHFADEYTPATLVLHEHSAPVSVDGLHVDPHNGLPGQLPAHLGEDPCARIQNVRAWVKREPNVGANIRSRQQSVRRREVSRHREESLSLIHI